MKRMPSFRHAAKNRRAARAMVILWGRISGRSSKNANHREAQRRWRAARYAEDPEPFRAQSRAMHAKHRDKRLAAGREKFQ